MLVELKSGETLNGHLVSCDTWMNLTLKEVVRTSAEGDRFFRLAEVYVRGNNVSCNCHQTCLGAILADALRCRSSTYVCPTRSLISSRSSNRISSPVGAGAAAISAAIIIMALGVTVGVVV